MDVNGIKDLHVGYAHFSSHPTHGKKRQVTSTVFKPPFWPLSLVCFHHIHLPPLFYMVFVFLSVHFNSRSFWLKTPSTIWSLPTSSAFPGPTEFASVSLFRPPCAACNVMRKVVAAHLLNQMCWLVVSIYPLLEVRSSTWRRKALCETMKQVSI